MRWNKKGAVSGAFLAALLAIGATNASPVRSFELTDVFELEFAGDPQISPDGGRIVYVRNFMDILTDEPRSNLWIVDFEGGGHRPLTSGRLSHRSPRWSPDGDRLAYVVSGDGVPQIHVRWMDSGDSGAITNLTEAVQDLAWSPDGRRIAFTSRVPESRKPFVSLPPKPEAADWADPPKVIERMLYRSDGSGFLKEGFVHLFVVSAEGGTPRQLTSGPFDHGGQPVWSPDGSHLLISANRHESAESQPRNSEIYEIRVADGRVRALTDRYGPNGSPAVSPDGRRIAYLGFDDRYQGYQVTRLYVMDRDGGNSRVLTESLDRDARQPHWDEQGRGIYFLYDDLGETKLAWMPLEGDLQTLASHVGGTTLGRPYASGAFSAAAGRFVFTLTGAHFPADLASGSRDSSEVRRLTRLNEDLIEQRRMGEVEEMWYESSYDGRRIQGWIAKPPDFDPSRKYPMILEIHGGPFANYGNRFSAEIQLFAAAGYVVLFANPRGSTSYGEEFGNLIHHNYPGQDYDDLISGVDALLAKGYVDPDQLFVTGGSGGGVLTAWIVGKTNRFRAAVAAKPVINWTSFALTADMYNFFYKYWFPGLPWEAPEHYFRRSPLSLVGNVTTPTMLLTGEEDFRTPMSETEQYYQALKLRGVDTALFRVPGAAHNIARRPSQLMAKVAGILEWFGRYREDVGSDSRQGPLGASPR